MPGWSSSGPGRWTPARTGSRFRSRSPWHCAGPVSVAAFRTFAGVLSSGSGTQQPSEREFKLATFQQLVTTPTVKEHLASSLQNNPICALLTARPGKQSQGQNGGFVCV
jgi:hypothetical protein